MKTTTLILASLLLLSAVAAPVAAGAPPLEPPPGYGTCHIENDPAAGTITVGPFSITPFIPRLVCYW